MKTLKYTFGILMSFLAIATFTSCSEEEADFTPAGPAAVEATEYYFTSGTKTNMVIGSSQKQIVFEVNRVNTESEATLDLIVTNPNDELFAVPASVNFAAGEATAQVAIEVSDSLVLFQEYQFTVQIPEKYTNPYVAENNNPTLHFVVMRDDYVPFAYGTYSSYFFEQSWEAVLEYSPSLELYRFKDCWVAGYDVTFKFDRETLAITMTSAAYASGYVHPSYGMVMATVYNKGTLNRYDQEASVFYFAYQWTVDAGSFGEGFDTFEVTEFAE